MNAFSTNPIRTFQQVWRTGKRSHKAGAIIAAMLGGVGLAAFYLSNQVIVEKAGQLGLGFSTVIWLYLDTALRARQEEVIEARVKKAEDEVAEHPDKTRPLWDLARSRLELYFERNLSQIKSIFIITLLAMAAGFVMIGYGIILAFDSSALKPSIVAAASGIVTEFIATTFLVIYRSTMSQAGEYVATLERINAVGMAIQIVDSIPAERGELKDKVRAELASKLLDTFAKRPPPSQTKLKR